MLLSHLVVATFSAAATVSALPASSVISLFSPHGRSTADVPVGRTTLAYGDADEIARLASLANNAYCPPDRNLVLQPRHHRTRRLGGSGSQHASSIIASSDDHPDSENAIDMKWYISHTPATHTLTLAFSSLPTPDDLLELLAAPAPLSLHDDHQDLPSYLFPPDLLPALPQPGIHHAYLPALESHGVDALVTLLKYLETPPAPSRSNSDVLRSYLKSSTGKGLETQSSIKHVEIVGHGLGAAVGLLTSLALRLETTGPARKAYTASLEKIDISSTLFGLPRVGDAVFASWVDSLITKSSSTSARTRTSVGEGDGNGGFQIRRITSYADAIPHLPGKHFDLVHPTLGEIWVDANPHMIYACRAPLGQIESPECSAGVPFNKTGLMDFAGPYAGISIGRGHCGYRFLEDM